MTTDIHDDHHTGQPLGLGSSEGLGAHALLRAFFDAAKREAREEAERDVWNAVADKVAQGDMAAAWQTLTRQLGNDRHAVTAVLGLLEWLINAGRVVAEHSVDEADTALPTTCCAQLDAECIGIRLSNSHGTLWLEAPNVISTNTPQP